MNQILYVQNKLNIKLIIIGLIILLFLCLLIFSTVFSLLNKNNPNILTGVKSYNIDLSNISQEDAIKKLQDNLNFEKISASNIDIVVNGITYTVSVDNLGITPNYEEMAKQAYNVGRNSNFLVNNFSILKTYFFGHEIKFVPQINDDIYDELVMKLKSNINETGADDIYEIKNDSILITKGHSGMVLDSESLKESIINSFVENDFSPINAKIITKEPNKVDLDLLYSQVTKQPADATVTTENGSLVYKEHIDGVTFDLQNAKQLVQDETKTSVTIPLIITKPNVTIDMLIANSFKDILATFESTYKESEKNRTTNVKLAASKINGVILSPGQEFSFNNIVGERTAANGFKTATVYANNKMEQGLGGGICQVSSTLYNSVLLSNLEIIERKNHQFAVSYVPLGRDATVAYGHIDFRFKNNRTTPIKIESKAENGTLIVTIMGTKSSDDVQVTLKTVTNATYNYETTKINDPTLAKGKQIVTQNGSKGYSISTYKITTKDGKELSNDLISTSKYSPLQKIVKVGTKETKPVTPVTPTPDPVTPPDPVDPILPSDPSDPGSDLPPGWDVPENPNALLQ